MNDFLPSIVGYLLCCSVVPTNTIIVDFETVSTSTSYQYFGSTIEGTLTEVIDNPDPTGINTSSMVGKYVKPTSAQTWAGAFSNPNPSILFDMTTNSNICVKVWFDAPGNLAFKLELPTTGAPNWIQTQAVSNVQQWTDVCFDVALDSEEDPFQPASGYIYQRNVLFFGFGSTVSGGADVTYYFDDIVLSK